MAESLSDEELASLRELTKGMMRRTIPAAHAEKLIALGLAEQKLGGLVATTIGRFAVL